MKKLSRYDLLYEPTLAFVRESLDGTNALSTELLQFIESQKGHFFTLLPQDADVERINLLDSFILKQNPVIEYGEGKKKARYQLVPTIRDELYQILHEKMKENENLVAVFDDFNSTFHDAYQDEFFDHVGCHYMAEVYYSIDRLHFSREVIQECFRISNVVWHSLCILTEVGSISKELNLDLIREICSKTQLALIGAYDGEGYIFWENNGLHCEPSPCDLPDTVNGLMENL